MTLSTCLFDNLYIHIHLEVVVLMLLVVEVVAIEVVVGAIVELVNVAVVVI